MDRKLILGNIISLVAGVFILIVLILLASSGIIFVFNVTTEALMWIIWGSAILAYMEYSTCNLKAEILMKVFPPMAIIITFIGLIFILQGKFLGLELIVLGYILEPTAGISLFLTIKEYSPVSAYLFFLGAVVYTLGLPLYLVSFPYLAIMGDVVKILGLVNFIFNSIRGKYSG